MFIRSTNTGEQRATQVKEIYQGTMGLLVLVWSGVISLSDRLIDLRLLGIILNGLTVSSGA